MNRSGVSPDVPLAAHHGHAQSAVLTRNLRDERGSAASELVLLTVALMVLLMFVAFCGRGADARLRLDDAAHQAARAASAARTPAAASAAARATAAAALQGAGAGCLYLTVETTGSLRPGTTVTTTVSCTLGLRDLALLLPGTRTLHARFTAPVDLYRGTTTTATASRGQVP
jgi:Flp pilus assembly protein TadG